MGILSVVYGYIIGILCILWVSYVMDMLFVCNGYIMGMLWIFIYFIYLYTQQVKNQLQSKRTRIYKYN